MGYELLATTKFKKEKVKKKDMTKVFHSTVDGFSYSSINSNEQQTLEYNLII